MRALLRRLRARARGERGFTVVEMVTAVTLMLIVGSVTGSILVSTTRATTTLERETQAVDALRIAMARIEREFRSAECVREPAAPAPGDPAVGDTLRFTTRSNGGTREVSYRVEADRLVREQDGVVTEVVTDVVGSGDAFTYAETPRRSVAVSLRVQPEHGNDRVLETTVAGRNAWRNC